MKADRDDRDVAGVRRATERGWLDVWNPEVEQDGEMVETGEKMWGCTICEKNKVLVKDVWTEFSSHMAWSHDKHLVDDIGTTAAHFCFPAFTEKIRAKKAARKAAAAAAKAAAGGSGSAASKRQKKQPASSESPTSTAQPAAKTPTTTHAATEAAGGAVGFGFDAAINALMADGITSSKRDMNRIQAAIIAKEQAAAPAPAPKAAVSAAERRAAQQRRLAKQLASTECAGAHFGFAAHFSPGQQPVESDQPWSRFTAE